jgi:AraC family transcriptional regulator
MGYGEDMARCRKYIEEHLSEEIALRALSERLGYSFYHFCHVFRSCNGISPGEYIRQRRLFQAARALSCGMRVTDAAMCSGFDTHSGFTRAFSRQFGITPSAYKKGVFDLLPEIKKFPAFSAIGYVLEPDERTDPRENGAYWLGKDFSSVSKEEYAKVTYPGYAEIGAWIHPEEKAGMLRYFLGATVKDIGYVPEGLVTLDVPAAEYAVFRVPAAADPQSLHDAVNATWKSIFSEWFDSCDYLFDQSKMDFEYYIGEDAFVYVPVLKK